MIFRTNVARESSNLKNEFFGKQQPGAISRKPAACHITTATALCGLMLAQISVPVTAAAQAVPYATSITPAVSQDTLPEDRGAAGLWQTLRKLDTWASLMTIVAHPCLLYTSDAADEEDSVDL